MSDDPYISNNSGTVEDSDLVSLNDKKTVGVPQILGIFSCVIVVAVALLYFKSNHGGFDPANYLEKKSISAEFETIAADLKEQGGGIVEVAADDPIALGEKIYMTNCMACHQVTGQGMPGAFPPLAGSDWAGKDPDMLARIVIAGIQGPIMVSGTEYNSIMAPLGAMLSDEDIANVLTYVRQAWGNDYPAVDASVVAEARAATGTRAMWTVPELEASME
ncbi:MAG: cytochrome c [Opitutales bacterium]|jgi:mono/diheme cytochrome c family protein|nr:cytochrome c [Opitutales bacterium]MDG2168024.1 cytochrome c [Opitutales bacterium]